MGFSPNNLSVWAGLSGENTRFGGSGGGSGVVIGEIGGIRSIGVICIYYPCSASKQQSRGKSVEIGENLYIVNWPWAGLSKRGR